MWIWKPKINHELAIQGLNERMNALEQDNKELQGEVDFLREKLVAAEGIIGSLQNDVIYFGQQYQHLENGLLAVSVDQLERFETERDHCGNLKHPCFPDVRQLMSELIAGGHCETLESSYQKAMELNLDNFNS